MLIGLLLACHSSDCPRHDRVLTWADGDGDGYGHGPSALTCPGEAGRAPAGGDCADDDPAVNPAAREVCDLGVDDDCDPSTHEEALSEAPVYADGDGDGYGGAQVLRTGCPERPGESAVGGDCADRSPQVHPGAEEICDGLDDDCDPNTSEDEVAGTTWYLDEDLDGFGQDASAAQGCWCPFGRTCATRGGDCDDLDASVGGPSSLFSDLDGDGHGAGDPVGTGCPGPAGVALDDDCDDAHARVFPGAPEHCDGLDDDCDGAVDVGVVDRAYADADGDGFGDPATGEVRCPGPGEVAVGGDCDDHDPEATPGAVETCGGSASDCDPRTDPCRPTCVWARSGGTTLALARADASPVASLPCDVEAVRQDGVPAAWAGEYWCDDLVLVGVDRSCRPTSILARPPLPGPDLVPSSYCDGYDTTYGGYGTYGHVTTIQVTCPGDDGYSHTQFSYCGYVYPPALGRPAFGGSGDLWVPFALTSEGGVEHFAPSGAETSPELAYPWSSPATGVTPAGADRLWVETGTELVGLDASLTEVARIGGQTSVDALDGRLVITRDGALRFADALDGTDLGPFEPAASQVLALSAGRFLAVRADGSVVVTDGAGSSSPWLPAGPPPDLVGLSPCPR